MFIPRKILEQKLVGLLTEDVGQGDVTVAAVVPQGLNAKAEIIAKAQGTIAGIEEATVLAEYLGLKVEYQIVDGQEAKVGQRIMLFSGDARTILTLERTILNRISRMSGIASATKELVIKIRKAKLKTRIAGTRKTALGLMYFDKKAICIGGGDTHRLHMDDMVLIKDNHLVLAGSIQNALEQAKKNTSFSKKIEVEVNKASDALKAAQLGADIIMLDNFSSKQVKETIRLLKKEGFFGKITIEASGGITQENLIEYASTGVDLISLGFLTNSVKALDISLEIIKVI
ncbi:MAG: carboxylating nicotinate-nucleotide diphosphorylase [Crenarchaeota archaeon]|nr:carboxylating nicotinate-nucleotide diphosphorylase [Thermoproteota archaeon]